MVSRPGAFVVWCWCATSGGGTPGDGRAPARARGAGGGPGRGAGRPRAGGAAAGRGRDGQVDARRLDGRVRCRPRRDAYVRGWCSAAGMPPLWPGTGRWPSLGLDCRGGTRARCGAPGPGTGGGRGGRALAGAARSPAAASRAEDVHWSDPVSVLVARAAAEAAAALPLMLLLTCRDEQDEATAGP